MADIPFKNPTTGEKDKVTVEFIGERNKPATPSPDAKPGVAEGTFKIGATAEFPASAVQFPFAMAYPLFMMWNMSGGSDELRAGIEEFFDSAQISQTDIEELSAVLTSLTPSFIKMALDNPEAVAKLAAGAASAKTGGKVRISASEGLDREKSIQMAARNLRYAAERGETSFSKAVKSFFPARARAAFDEMDKNFDAEVINNMTDEELLAKLDEAFDSEFNEKLANALHAFTSRATPEALTALVDKFSAAAKDNTLETYDRGVDFTARVLEAGSQGKFESMKLGEGFKSVSEPARKMLQALEDAMADAGLLPDENVFLPVNQHIYQKLGM